MKFSIITISLNCADTIESTIKSVLSQEGIDIEYIIIDGMSIDGTKAIIERYTDKLTYWISEPDKGLFDAMNKGIQKASGEIIAFINAGDYYKKNILKKIQNYFDKSQTDVIGGSIIFRVNDMISTVIETKYSLDQIPLHMVPHQALFVKKNVFDKIGLFNITYKLAADYEWFLRIWKNKINVLVVVDICADCDANGITSRFPYDLSIEAQRAALEVIGKDNCIIKGYIDRYYNDKLEKVFYEQRYENELLHIDVRKLKKIVKDERYMIWGTGRAGMRCLQLMERFDIDVKGFIDNYKANTVKKIGKYNVYNPREMEKTRNFKICVAAREFENQIEKQLLNSGFSKNDYILFSELLRSIVDCK